MAGDNGFDFNLYSTICLDFIKEKIKGNQSGYSHVAVARNLKKKKASSPRAAP